jgi:hypothetical protein
MAADNNGGASYFPSYTMQSYMTQLSQCPREREREREREKEAKGGESASTYVDSSTSNALACCVLLSWSHARRILLLYPPARYVTASSGQLLETTGHNTSCVKSYSVSASCMSGLTVVNVQSCSDFEGTTGFAGHALQESSKSPYAFPP